MKRNNVRDDLADSIQAAKDENITLIRYNSSTGEAWRITPDGKIEPYDVGPGQSDWVRTAAMTDEEIEAADTSDEGLPDDWLEHATIVRVHGKEVGTRAKYVMCVNNTGYLASLTLRRVYKVIPDEKGENRGMIRIMDDTGEDYLFPTSAFVPVQIPEGAERSFDLAVA